MAPLPHPQLAGKSGVSSRAGRRESRASGGAAWATLLGMAAAALVAVPSPVALAQTTKKPAGKAEAAAPAEQPTGEEWTTKEPEVTADGRPRDPELGDPPTTTDQDAEQRPSPLTPRPEEMPGRPSGETPDYDALLAELTALRARVQALTAALYESKLRISLEVDGEDVRIGQLRVTVDGGVVYVAPERFVGAEDQVVYEHAVAPGRHVIGIEVERFDPRIKGYRTWQATRYAVEVPEKRTLAARIELEDDSSMKDASSGRYRSRADLRVEVIEP